MTSAGGDSSSSTGISASSSATRALVAKASHGLMDNGKEDYDKKEKASHALQTNIQQSNIDEGDRRCDKGKGAKEGTTDSHGLVDKDKEEKTLHALHINTQQSNLDKEDMRCDMDEDKTKTRLGQQQRRQGGDEDEDKIRVRTKTARRWER